MDRADSPGPSPLPVRSNRSRDKPPNLSHEPGPSGTEKKKRGGVPVDKQTSHCALCQGILKDPVSALCGQCFCRQCFGEQGAPSGDCSCPLCRQTTRTAPALQTASVASSVQNCGLLEVLDKHRIGFKKRFEHVTEGTGSRALLRSIYTNLYITEGECDEVNTQHELGQLETTFKKTGTHTPIMCCDIFRAFDDQRAHIRVVLTNGVAGIGKTFSVQKFTLDWAEGLENKDVSLLVLFSFQELNMIKDEQYSLLELLHVFHPTLQGITAEELAACKTLFIFDGLDESRLSLDFDSGTLVTDVTLRLPVSVLLTNLLRGNLLPSALVWITSRPVAANQIPQACVDRLTEVQGFTDAQKEVYFRNRCRNEELSGNIISHIQASKSLNIMCRIPIFCWISAKVLEHMLTSDPSRQLPKTMTDLYSHFLLVQIKRKENKYDGGHAESPQELMEANRGLILKLGRLAFEHLEQGNLTFYQEDLEQVGLDGSEALVCSGFCTEIFLGECVIFQKTVYCFVHLSVQEFLAAVYIFHCYTDWRTEILEDFLKQDHELLHANQQGQSSDLSLDDFLRRAMEKSIQSKNGHLDLFVRFLHGLCLEPNQRLLGSLLSHTHKSPPIPQGSIIKNLKRMDSENISPDRSINIFHCLTEMKDRKVHQMIEVFLKSGDRSGTVLSLIHCSCLAYMLQMSESVLLELELKNYKASNEGRRRLIPAVRNCKIARLEYCGFSETHFEVVASALKSNPSHLRVLDLSLNDLRDSGVKLLCPGLKSPHCRLVILCLKNCNLTHVSCSFLASALMSNPSHLRNLDLGYNKLQDSGVKELCEFLQSEHCELCVLRLTYCLLSKNSCASLVSALESNPSHLRCLHLHGNELQKSDLKPLAYMVHSPDYKLQKLSWSESEET